MSRKLVSVVLVLSLFIAILAACSGNNGGKTSESPTNAAKETTKPTDAPIKNNNQYGDTGGLTLPLVDKPTTITWMVVSESTNLNDKMFTKEIEKRTGIKIDFKAYTPATYLDKLKVTVASGKLPDIFHGLTPPELKKIGQQKAVVAINEYADMLPNFKRLFMEENDWVIKSFGDASGNLYTWPLANINRDVNHGFLFRKDIFDKLGIKEWTNQDEFYQALVKLKEAYPTSYPLASKTKEYIFRDWSYGWGIGGASYPAFYDEDAKVWDFATTSAKHKEMLDFMKKLYNEGLLDPEFLTDTSESWTAKMTTDKSFVTFDWIGRLDLFHNQVKDQNPDYNLRYGNPVGPTGNGATLPKVDNSFSIAVTNNENKEASLKLLDYLSSPSGATLVTMGIEGETFTIDADGKAVYPELTDVPLVDIKVLEDRYGLWLQGLYVNADKRSVYYNFTEKEQEAQTKRLEANSFEAADPILNFSDEENAQITEIHTSLLKSANEFNAKYIFDKSYGEKEWEAWKKTAEKMGAVKLIEIYNAAQKRYDEAH